MNDEELCPTCGHDNDDPKALYCSNLWHLTGENCIPQVQPWEPT